MICQDILPPIYLIFSDSVPDLLYYSHIPTAIISIIVGFFIFKRSGGTHGRHLLIISMLFSTWIFSNLIVWTSVDSGIIMFVGSLFGIISILLSTAFLFFIYNFIKKEKMGLIFKTIIFIPVSLLIILNQNNVSGFDLSLCGATGGEYYYYAFYIFDFIVLCTILCFGFYKYFTEKTDFKKQILLLLFGVGSFLFLFISTGFISSYLYSIGYSRAFEIEQYGLFGMAFFFVVIGYMIVRYRAFNVKMAGAEALVSGLLILIFSQLFFVEGITEIVLVTFTFALTVVGGYYLVRNVKNEIRQREELKKLTKSLEISNSKLKFLDKQKSEFLSIASHQLRSPLTAIRGYSSMLLEGSYGQVPPDVKVPLARIHQSACLMAQEIEDYLNISRIEAGNMKYNLSDLSLPEQVSLICDDMRKEAQKNGLAFIYRTELNGNGIVNADVGKVVQIVQNLISNAIKYTRKGLVRVVVRDDVVQKKIFVDVIDTGIGMSSETMVKIFQKFERADNANEANIHGTGLGLYVAVNMARAMGGNIIANSDGNEKGSKFTVDFPLVL